VDSIIEEAANGALTKVRIPIGLEKEYQVSDKGVMENSFTLISCQEQHYLQLFAQFHGWLVNSPAKEVCSLVDHFLNSLKSRYREMVLSYSKKGEDRYHVN